MSENFKGARDELRKHPGIVRELLLVVLRTALLILLVALMLGRLPKEQNFQTLGVISGMVVFPLFIYSVFSVNCVQSGSPDSLTLGRPRLFFLVRFCFLHFFRVFMLQFLYQTQGPSLKR